MLFPPGSTGIGCFRGEDNSPLGSLPAVDRWVPHTPVFPVMLGGTGELHAAFLNESRTRGRRLVPRTGNPGISLVFREMWETRTVMFLQLRQETDR